MAPSVYVEAEGASYGGCYDYTTHAVSCAYNESDCGSSYWMTPGDLSGYGLSCSLADIDVGSCYSHTTHVATCVMSEDMCPTANYSHIDHETGEGYGVECEGHMRTNEEDTLYGMCKADDGSHVCSFSSQDCMWGGGAGGGEWKGGDVGSFLDPATPLPRQVRRTRRGRTP